MAMTEEFQFVSSFLRGDDLPEGKAVEFTAKKNRDGKIWGWRPSRGQFGAEIILPDGKKQRVEFFICLEAENGEIKEFTRNSKGFWQRLKELNVQEGEKVSITRVGKDRDARYSIQKG